LSVQEKILHRDKEKAKYCYLTFSNIFHFSAIIFHVDSCESYATLDQDERQKSGFIILFTIFMLCDIENIVSATSIFVCFKQVFWGCFGYFADFQIPYLTNVSFCATICTSPIGKSH